MRRRLTAVTALVLLVWCGTAGVAMAAVPSETSFEGKLSLGMIGPFGGIVAGIGVVGLVVGLVRHRRRAAREARLGDGQPRDAVAGIETVRR